MNADSSVVSAKGQLVIPARIRRRLGIRSGTRVSIVEDGDRLILQPMTREAIHRLRGCLKDGPSALDFLLRERKRERTL